MVPYGYTKTLPKDYNKIVEASKVGVAALKKVHGVSFAIGSPANLLCNTIPV
jgi:hypothetical protein